MVLLLFLLFFIVLKFLLYGIHFTTTNRAHRDQMRCHDRNLDVKNTKKTLIVARNKGLNVLSFQTNSRLSILFYFFVLYVNLAILKTNSSTLSRKKLHLFLILKIFFFFLIKQCSWNFLYYHHTEQLLLFFSIMITFLLKSNSKSFC